MKCISGNVKREREDIEENEPEKEGKEGRMRREENVRVRCTSGALHNHGITSHLRSINRGFCAILQNKRRQEYSSFKLHLAGTITRLHITHPKQIAVHTQYETFKQQQTHTTYLEIRLAIDSTNRSE